MNLHMIHHWKDLDLEITDFHYQHHATPSGYFIPFQTSNVKHVENMKISDKHT